jgi:hypothetical protein
MSSLVLPSPPLSSTCRVWTKWKAFLYRTQVKKWNFEKRQWESARLCLARWKVFTALEKYFKKCFLKRLTQKYFNSWREFLCQQRAVKRADAFFVTLTERRILRKMLMDWRKHCILLPWDTQELRSVEGGSKKYRLTVCSLCSDSTDCADQQTKGSEGQTVFQSKDLSSVAYRCLSIQRRVQDP